MWKCCPWIFFFIFFTSYFHKDSMFYFILVSSLKRVIEDNSWLRLTLERLVRKFWLEGIHKLRWQEEVGRWFWKHQHYSCFHYNSKGIPSQMSTWGRLVVNIGPNVVTVVTERPLWSLFWILQMIWSFYSGHSINTLT